MTLRYVACLIALLACISSFGDDPSSLIREEQTVIVDGVEELWRLEWVSPPSPICSPDDDNWYTCPCSGFAFGESGELVLVRQRPGQQDERFPLTQLFRELANYDAPGEGEEAILRRWNVNEKDLDESKSPDFASRVMARPLATVMNIGDYDHDGGATEFVLQVGTLPCGKKMSVVIGISRDSPRLHVFRSVEHPERPLVLQASQWEALRKAKGSVKVIDWPCGDHGSPGETELELSADAGSIRATRTVYECHEDLSRGPFVSKEQL